MWHLWSLVGHGEVVNVEENKINWSVDWVAFREARSVRHALTREDPPEELFEAMIVIRSEMMQPAGNILLEQSMRLQNEE